MGREVAMAVTAGRLDFGPWEQIFYGEFDGGSRETGSDDSSWMPLVSRIVRKSCQTSTKEHARNDEDQGVILDEGEFGELVHDHQDDGDDDNSNCG
jgi:hypothetical protein